jgi:hypothetical protein
MSEQEKVAEIQRLQSAFAASEERVKELEARPMYGNDEVARIKEKYESDNAALQERVKELEKVGAAADRYEALRAALVPYLWMAEGRGAYSYDDPRYGEDVKRCMRSLLECLPPYQVISKQIIDIEKDFWESIKRSAAESRWIPEQYTMNDWILDVCCFLNFKK